MATVKPFVFNDGSKNSHGFRIDSSNIDLTRFKKNPVMLDLHWENNRSVLGKWVDITLSDGVITALPEFDEDDDDAKYIAGKVERGYINSCSMGLKFTGEDMRYVDGELVLEKAELYEVSIVPIPSNANSVRLYAADTGDLLSEEEIKKICLSAIPTSTEETPPNNKNNDMKIKLNSAVLLALGFAAGTTEVDASDLEAKVTKLSAEKQAAELKLLQKLEAEETARLAAVEAEVAQAVKDGKITADNKEKFVNLGIANSELLTETLAAIPTKKSLGDMVTRKGETHTGEVETPEDFQKLSLEAKLHFKQTQPEAYKQLFTSKK